ncbi:MAG: hypothetical protein JWN65_991 [Solirubrobacterales bacterium]|nr:hypothetical protein [Solirubrobacterales bacterium]
MFAAADSGTLTGPGLLAHRISASPTAVAGMLAVALALAAVLILPRAEPAVATA